MIEKYTAKDGAPVARSSQHEDMYIVSFEDGGFFAVSSDEKTIMDSYPPRYLPERPKLKRLGMVNKERNYALMGPKYDLSMYRPKSIAKDPELDIKQIEIENKEQEQLLSGGLYLDDYNNDGITTE